METDRIITDEDLDKLDGIGINEVKQSDSEEDIITEKEQVKISKDANRIRHLPWGVHNQNKNNVPTPKELYDHVFYEIYRVSKDNKGLKRAAVLILTYLAGARINEVLPNKKVNYPGLKKSDIKLITKEITRNDTTNTLEIIEIQTLIEKLKKNREYKENKKNYIFEYKKMQLVISKNGKETTKFKLYYKPMIELLDKFLDEIESTESPYLFEDINSHQLEMYMARNLEDRFNFHLLRHYRATHLKSIHKFKEADLRTLLGWTPTSTMPVKYTHNTEEDILIQMGE